MYNRSYILFSVYPLSILHPTPHILHHTPYILLPPAKFHYFLFLKSSHPRLPNFVTHFSRFRRGYALSTIFSRAVRPNKETLCIKKKPPEVIEKNGWIGASFMLQHFLCLFCLLNHFSKQIFKLFHFSTFSSVFFFLFFCSLISHQLTFNGICYNND